jgi:quaternary ammonium compound-resistance protein SugE
MAWVYLIAAGFLEIGFALCLKASDGFSKPLYTAGFLLFATLSFAGMNLALRDLPIGTAYAVWTGIGAAGAALFGMLLFDESGAWTRLFFVGVIVAGVIGLRVTGGE